METQPTETIGVEIFEAQERASIDSQVATAKMYPRNLREVRNNSVAIACLDKATAESCRFSKPVAGKKITGPSVHLARIVCQQYGNIRVQQRIKHISQTTIIAEAVAFDMETNYAVCVEARRNIVDRTGKRYKDHVIETNAMAILAIAERNAILKVIPKSIIDSVYNSAFEFANGDLSDETKLVIEVNKVFTYLKNEYKATEEEVLTCIGVHTKASIKAEHVVDLRGYIQALKDKEIDINDLFNRENRAEKKSNEEIKDQKEPEAEKPTVQI